MGQANPDYTSLPYEEPTSLGDRLREAPLGVKLLLLLVPFALIVAGIVLWLDYKPRTAPLAPRRSPKGNSSRPLFHRTLP